MADALQRRPRVAFISTREIDEESAAGRVHIARAIRSALEGWSDLTTHRLPSVLTDPSLGRFLDAALAAFWSLFRHPVLPLQCAIFAGPRDLERLIEFLVAPHGFWGHSAQATVAEEVAQAASEARKKARAS